MWTCNFLIDKASCKELMSKEKLYRICCHCVMDTTDSEIFFNENGVCNHCQNYESKKESYLKNSDPKNLDDLLKRIKARGAGKKYNCVIGLSGGVDSSYVAYLVKKKFNLNPIAIHLDNGWNSELAVHNIENVVKKLDIDFLTHVLNWEEFKDLQLSFFKASVANCEAPTDHAITALLLKTASQFNLKYIISGSNFVTENILPKSWGYDNRDWKHIKSIHKIFGKKRLKTFPHYSLLDIVKFIIIKKIRVIPILNYIEYNKQDAIKILETELNWKRYEWKHYESQFTKFFQGYYLPQKFGFDKRRAHLSTMICSGQITRQDALKALESPPYLSAKILEAEKKFVIKKLELSDEEFDVLLKRPSKSYLNYPSHHWLLKKNRFLEKIKKLIMKP